MTKGNWTLAVLATVFPLMLTSGAGARFLQIDPVGYPADQNLYAYVGNNPTDATDPSGQIVQAIDPKQEAILTSMINSRARGTYKFDDHGRLVKVSSTSHYSERSEYYGSRLDVAIQSPKTLNLLIANTY